MLSRLKQLTLLVPSAVTGHWVKVHRSPPAHRDRSVPASAHDHHDAPAAV